MHASTGRAIADRATDANFARGVVNAVDETLAIVQGLLRNPNQSGDVNISATRAAYYAVADNARLISCEGRGNVASAMPVATPV